ncbi:MAG: histidine phosphatase family protein [Moraxellaceae bacterium]|nr:histidine phosphatase family protein [Moraxellaceae bacterium]
MASLYLIRHGQASFGAENYDSLSELGKDQCHRLGVWWRERGHAPARVLVGPMLRHRQSAEAFMAGYEQSLAMVNLDGLAEFDHENVLEVYRPDFADKSVMANFLAITPSPRQAFHRIFTEAVSRWHDGRFDGEYNESWPHFKARVLASFDQLRSTGGDALVFTSGGVVSVMVQKVLSLTDANSFAINATIHNSSVTRMLYRADETSLHSFNSTAHLDIHNDAHLLTYR